MGGRRVGGLQRLVMEAEAEGGTPRLSYFTICQLLELN